MMYHPYYIVIEFWIAIYPIALLYALMRPLMKSLEEEYRVLVTKYEKAYKEYEKSIMVKT